MRKWVLAGLWVLALPCFLVNCDWFAGQPNGTEGDGGEGGSEHDGTTTPVGDSGQPDSRAAGEGGHGDGGSSDAAGDALDAPTESSVPGDTGSTDAGCACMYGCFDGACSGPFSSLSGTSAATPQGSVPLVTVTNNGASTSGGPASHTDNVTITTYTGPGGSVRTVSLVWSLDPVFGTSNPVAMTLQTSTQTQDTWTGVIPAQAAGSEVYLYVVATPFSGSSGYDPSGFGSHYAYAVN